MALEHYNDLNDVNQIFFSPMKRPNQLHENVFLDKIKTYLQIIIGIGMSGIFFRIIFHREREKEKNIISLKYLKGMKRKYYWCSMILEYLILSLLASIPCGFITKYCLITHTNIGLILGFYFIHCMNQFSFAVFCSAFFNSSSVAIICGGSIYFMNIVIGLMLNTFEFAFINIAGASIIPPIGAITFISLITDLEVC